MSPDDTQLTVGTNAASDELHDIVQEMNEAYSRDQVYEMIASTTSRGDGLLCSVMREGCQQLFALSFLLCCESSSLNTSDRRLAYIDSHRLSSSASVTFPHRASINYTSIVPSLAYSLYYLLRCRCLCVCFGLILLPLFVRTVLTSVILPIAYKSNHDRRL
jgi:hypothetical protein